MISKALNYISPCVIGVLFCLTGIVFSFIKNEETDGWSSLAIPLYFLAIVIMIFLDAMLKSTFKRKTLMIWIIEISLMGIFVLGWYLFK